MDNRLHHETSLRLSDIVTGRNASDLPQSPYTIGILPGEGIGPEIIAASLGLLGVIQDHYPISFDLRWGGKIGKDAIAESGQALSEEVIRFCNELFRCDSPVFCGPGGERFVYDLRRQFDLYCKLAPIDPLPAMAGTGPLKPSAVASVDILVVRESTGGLYQGNFGFEQINGARHAYHRFDYVDTQVVRIMDVASRIANHRSGKLCVVTKPGGVPSISRLWEEMATESSIRHGVELRTLEIDNACYQIIADAGNFDVVVAPNMFGDVIVDNAALLLGSRGMSYSANFSASGCAVYQTGHGAAHDLTGMDRANPIGQMLSLAMLLQESFGLSDIAAEIRLAINDTVAAGWRTADIAFPGCQVVGTRALAEHISNSLHTRLEALHKKAELNIA